MQNAKTGITLIIQLPNEISISNHCGEAAGTHSANFDEKVHKPQSKYEASQTVYRCKNAACF